MSRASYSGNYPDHVTRYNHKPNRWMAPMRPRSSICWADIATGAFLGFCLSGALVALVMMLEAM